MGARTDFIKAMVLGVIVGVAITTAFFQLRTPACPIPEPPAPSPTRVHIEPVPEPPLAPADAAVDAAPNPRRQSLVDKLEKVGLPIAEVQLTCTATCCELTLEDIAYDEHAADIKAAFEITSGTPWQSRKIGTLRVIERCW
jgi:hypothetical protein